MASMEQIPDDLAEKAAKVMNECGASNIIKAKYTQGIAQAVSNSNRTIFCQMKPHVINRKDKAWIETYKLLNKWLDKEKRQLTKETMKIEMDSRNVPFPNDEPVVSFKSLIALTRVRPDTLEEKVEEFISQVPNIKFIESREPTEIKMSSELSKSETKSEVIEEGKSKESQIEISAIDPKKDEMESDGEIHSEKSDEKKNDTKDDILSDFSYESIGDTKVEPISERKEPEHTGFTSSSGDDFISDIVIE